LNRVVTVVLIIVLLAVIGAIVYVIAAPKIGERFTEFCVLGPGGRAADYPVELEAGEVGTVTIGIINREYEAASYRVEVAIDGEKDDEIGPIMLQHGEAWERQVSFVFEVTGEKQKVEFFLYKDEEVQPYFDPLRLWVEVR